MKPARKPMQRSLEHKGCWPFSLEPFDRTPSLSTSEIEALSLWHSYRLQHPTKSLKLAEQHLHRLLVPLDAVLGAYGEGLLQLSTARAYILSRMHKTQTSFWAWGEQEWLDCVGVRYEDFPHFKACNSKDIRNHVLACAYLLGNAPTIMYSVVDVMQQPFARKIFGTAALEHGLAVVAAEAKRMGFGESAMRHRIPALLSEAFLISRSSCLEDLTVPIIEQLRKKAQLNPGLRHMCILLAQVLHNLQLLPYVPQFKSALCRRHRVGVEDNVSPEWAAWVERWYAASTMPTRDAIRVKLFKAGRWCGENLNITSPTQWTRDTCTAYVTAVDEMTRGKWLHPESKGPASKRGKPLSPGTKAGLISAIQTFFTYCQEEEWLPPVFNPGRYLAIPPSITKLIDKAPRVIADDTWARLMHAGIELTYDDLNISKASRLREGQAVLVPYYPFEMVRAVAIIWLFAGLRANEIRRLSVGCIRWEEQEQLEGADSKGANAFCWLTVPVNKTSKQFDKPVDPLVGHAIQAWEKMRPTGPPQRDTKSEKEVHYLYRWRGEMIGKNYLNKFVIPMLCRKAGVSVKDAQGSITSHRARATIATQLYNAPDGLSIYGVSKWLGHKNLCSTQSYVLITPTRLAESYAKAGYGERNRRTMDVLLEQDATRDGADAAGHSRLMHDLGHGFCTYDFYAQCESRTACTRCAFYQPKDSKYVQMVETKGNLLRLKESTNLSNEQIEAVDDGIAALERLIKSFQDVAIPQAPTLLKWVG